MKKLFIIFLILFLISCTPTEVKTVEKIVTKTIEDTTRIDELNKQLAISNKETEKYQKLIANLNELLKNVYYVYQKKNDGSSSWGTGFSLEYKGKYYLITAGHIVDGKYGKFINLGFKSNFANDWIYPKLLTYDVIRDYAIFYSDKITSGLDFDLKNSYPEFILGNEDNNIFKEFNTFNLIEGECGSPIIDLDGEIIGIATGSFVDINLVIETIDNLN